MAVVAAMAVEQEADVADAKSNTAGKTVRVTWVKSAIGYSKDQKATIKALGFRRLNQTLEKADTPQVRGQIFKVKHMLRIEEV